jgi:succinate dehydrogenase hydrophobic anchor subunit
MVLNTVQCRVKAWAPELATVPRPTTFLFCLTILVLQFLHLQNGLLGALRTAYGTE